MLTDRLIREQAHRFFDALENTDVATIADIYHPDMIFWVNLTPDTDRKGSDNLKTLEAGSKLNRRRLYNDRRINTFDNGFVCQYSCDVVKLDGRKSNLQSAVVVRMDKDGRFVRLDEYLDSSKFLDPLPKAG
jgi:ketosteroid isomerase-like protein